jgi:hypothetical protein
MEGERMISIESDSLRTVRAEIAFGIVRDNPSTLEYIHYPQMIPTNEKLKAQVGVLKGLCEIDVQVKYALEYAFRRRKKTIPPQRVRELLRRDNL